MLISPLQAGGLDIAFMINAYHHLEKPVELVRNLLPALKEGGILFAGVLELSEGNLDLFPVFG